MLRQAGVRNCDMRVWRVRKLSATCLGVRPCRPLAFCGKGKLPCPNGTTPSQLFIVTGSTTVDEVRSRDNLNDRTPDRKPIPLIRSASSGALSCSRSILCKSAIKQYPSFCTFIVPSLKSLLSIRATSCMSLQPIFHYHVSA